jgi:hypothetical protein
MVTMSFTVASLAAMQDFNFIPGLALVQAIQMRCSRLRRGLYRE